MVVSFSHYSTRAASTMGGASGVGKESTLQNISGFNKIVVFSSVVNGHTLIGIAPRTSTELLRFQMQPSVQRTNSATSVTNLNFNQNSISGFHTAEELGHGALAPKEVAKHRCTALCKPACTSWNHSTLHPSPSAILTLNQHNYTEL